MFFYLITLNKYFNNNYDMLNKNRLFIISIYAAYLSFSCTWKGIVSNIVARLLFGFAAFMLGPFYLLWYFFVNYLGNMC